MSISDITINGKQNTTKQVMQNIEYILNGHSDIDFNTKIQEKRRNSHQSILNNSLYHNNSQNLNQCQERQHLQNSNMEIEVQNLKQRLSTMEKDNFQQLNQKDQDEKKIYQIRNNQQGVNINQRLNNLQSFYEQKIAILEDKIIELEQENDLINKEKIYFEKQCQNKQIQLENIQQQLYEELKQVFEEQQNERKFENEREKIIMTQQYNELYDKFVKLQDDFLFKFNILNEEKIQLKENTIQAMKKQIKSIQEDTDKNQFMGGELQCHCDRMY